MSEEEIIEPDVDEVRPRGRAAIFFTVLAVIFFAALTVWAFQSVGVNSARQGDAGQGNATGAGSVVNGQQDENGRAV